MKKIKRITSTALTSTLLLLVAGCDSNFLERRPINEFDEAAVWSEPALVRGFVSKMYERMDHGFKAVNIASLTDESFYTHDWHTYHIVQGTTTPEMGTGFADRIMLMWRENFIQIRNTNAFFDNIGQVPFADAGEKDQITGEVHFLRAWFYFGLLRLYGGVPILDRVYGLNEAETLRQLKRASFAETVDFILADIEKAIPLLKEAENVPRGIIHKDAAKALRSRVTLHAASDLYNQSGNTNPLVGYISTDPGTQENRWLAARVAAEVIIDEKKYALYAPTNDPRENYSRIFLDKGNPEAIFCKLFHKELMGTYIDLWHGPNGWRGWSGSVPLQNLVDVYQTKDGTDFSWGTPDDSGTTDEGVPWWLYTTVNPYEDREPRFYATILYNGAPWRKRTEEGVAKDPVGVIQTARFEYWNGTKLDTIFGLDTRNGGIENWNGSHSGYNLRKFMDITNPNPIFFRGDQDYIFFRYAEILLNHAEACIALKDETAAKASLKMVRERAGLPGEHVQNVSGDALTKIYHYERRVELAYEEHRFYDARRWMTAEVDFDKNAQAINIFGKLQIPTDNSSLKYEYTVINLQERSFPKKMYFMPIPAGEIRANGNLVQNPGY